MNNKYGFNAFLCAFAFQFLVFTAAAIGPGPSPTPTPSATPTPPPANCDSTSLNMSLPSRPSVYSWSVGATNHNETATASCADVPAVDGFKYSGGDLSTKCEDGVFSSPTNSCVVDAVNATCSIVTRVGVSKEEIVAAFADAGKVSQANNLFRDFPNGSVPQNNMIKLKVGCSSVYASDNSSAGATMRGAFQVSGLSACNSSSTGLCYLDPNDGVNAGTTTFTTTDQVAEPADASNNPIKSDIIYVWNKSSSTAAKIPNGSVSFQYQSRIGNSWQTPVSDPLNGIEVPGVEAEATGCELKVSGAISAYSGSNPPLVATTNDVLIFTVNLIGGSGALGVAPAKVSFAGGPNTATGVWSNPPVGKPSTVTASVETGATKQNFTCSLTVLPQGKAAMLRLRRFGDCSYFNNLRSYYFTDASGKSFQNSGYNPPLSMPGIEAQYGTVSGEVPFRGVLNAAAAMSGEIAINSSGKVIIPPIDNRGFSKAVVVAKRFNSKSSTKATEPLFYGVMDLNDYSLTQMYQVAGVDAKDDESIVFQAFLAGTQTDGLRDLRGTPSGLPYYMFSPSTKDGKPYDRVVPFMNESCVPLFQIGIPKRSDKDLPAALSSATQCMYSRPYKVADIRAGRVDLTVLHIVPEHAHNQFPAELFKASSQPPCVAKNPSNVKSCWDVKSSSLGVAANANPFTAHDSCRTVTPRPNLNLTVNTPTQSCNYSGCSWTCETIIVSNTISVPQAPIITYKGSCPVLESVNECTQNLAIRFSGYNQMMIASLGCAAKYDRAGELVAGTLRGAGVLPYTPTLGGSAPKPYQSYPVGYGDSKGYACIPCRFGNDAAAAGQDVVADTAALPVDQDASSARKPVFSFNKLKAPAECVRDISFEVRYFGSKECNGVSAPPGHFCKSENLGGQSCSSTDGMGSGNVAGKFTIPVCPNSGFEYDNVSVSWSPLLIDSVGNGIEISRDLQYAVSFDMRATGKKMLVDWPVNTKEVAFLVKPNAQGKVESIKELFGDYKAKDGFAALAKYDDTKDGKIDRRDKVYAQLKLWFDANRDGVATQSELKTLEEYGVQVIYLQSRQITNRGTEGKTLSSVYYNSRYKEFFNLGDYFFNQYKEVVPKKEK